MLNYDELFMIAIVVIMVMYVMVGILLAEGFDIDLDEVIQKVFKGEYRNAK